MGNEAMALLFEQVAREVVAEATRAAAKWPPYGSAHEAYGLLAEELAEFFDCVRTNQNKRDIAEMRAELVQLAAVAFRTIIDVCDGGKGRA